MNSENALNARGWALQGFRSALAPEAATPFPANPDCRSVDLISEASARTPNRMVFSDSYQVAIQYPLSTKCIPISYLSGSNLVTAT